MTATRDPDRLLRAWLDLMPDEAPDRVVSAVLQATEGAPQLRRPLVPTHWRLPMNRISILATAAIIAVVVGGVAFFFRPVSNVGPHVTPTPSIPAPTETPLTDVSRHGLGRGMGYQSTAPTILTEATWVADVDLIQGLMHDARISMSTSLAGKRLNIHYQDGTSPMINAVVTGAAEYLSLVALSDGSGCHARDFGDYQMLLSEDGLTMTLTPRGDDCATRRSLLARTWSRSLDRDNHGGRGVIDAFAPGPIVALTLPAGSYTNSPAKDSAWIESQGGLYALLVLRNPFGLSQPCTQTGGSKVPVAPSVEAFTGYLDTHPGFTVRRDAIELGGLPAVHVTIPTVATDDCASHRVIEWTSSVPGASQSWFITQGDPDSLYLVEVGRPCGADESGTTCTDLYLFQWLGPRALTTQEERSVLDTITFLPNLASAST